MNQAFQDMTTDQAMRGILATGSRRAYMLAGKSTVTIRSIKSGVRYTYAITRPVDSTDRWFVGVLTGPENSTHYSYIGMLFRNDGKLVFQLTRGSKLPADSPSVKAFQWFADHLETDRAEVWHEGACGRCGRKLTVPESIATGLGPTCAGYIN